jgi:hypothetical protein
MLNREWAMPNSATFEIAPIRALIDRVLTEHPGIWADPFVRDSRFKHRMTFTNDLNNDFAATSHTDAREFLQRLPSDSLDGVLFDPPYSPRQITECYQGVGLKASMTDTQSSFYSTLKQEISRVVRNGGVVVSCCWNSGGIGKSRGFTLTELLLVAHGGWHNDTIVTVERMDRPATLFDGPDGCDSGSCFT